MKNYLLAGASIVALAALASEADAALLFNSSTPGVYSFTAASAGVYDILVDGAQGGGNIYYAGGLGAEVEGLFTLSAGEMLTIRVGSNPGFFNGAGAAGGGGSFVAGPGNSPLAVAGGGGGPAGYRGCGYGPGDAQAGTAGGGGGGCYGGGGAGGTGGSDGSDGTGAFYGYNPGQGGKGFLNGAYGGANGGYGGGGGGGGFSGGGGGAGRAFGARGGGGGGGSYLAPAATLLSDVGGVWSGNGRITINGPADTPEPASLGLMLGGAGALLALRRRKRA